MNDPPRPSIPALRVPTSRPSRRSPSPNLSLPPAGPGVAICVRCPHTWSPVPRRCLLTSCGISWMPPSGACIRRTSDRTNLAERVTDCRLPVQFEIPFVQQYFEEVCESAGCEVTVDGPSWLPELRHQPQVFYDCIFRPELFNVSRFRTRKAAASPASEPDASRVGGPGQACSCAGILPLLVTRLHPGVQLPDCLLRDVSP